MKKIALLATALVAMASMASAASIVNTKHDLHFGSSGPVSDAGLIGTNTNQICIFCHTPHNPVTNVPLWNRANPAAGGWTMYASPTLSASATTKLGGGSFDNDSISLFCMSCHDGVTTMGAFTNKAGITPEALIAIPGASKANIGGAGGNKLNNDHPVGFNYEDAQAQDTGLKALGTANTNLGGSAFFGATGKMIECSSCHKVHDNAFPPFLRKTNDNSALCLACHDK